MKNISLLLAFLLFVNFSYAQSEQQTIRGTVYDKQSHSPLPGAVVIATAGSQQYNTTCSTNGEFSLKVPLGRCNISVKLVGFNDQNYSNILIHSGKETVLEVFLEERVDQLEEAVIVAKVDKDKPLNRMATVSARMLSTEEADRYAGSWSDPARMAANLAGVASGNDSRNDIVIRGNSPVGLQWRLDGFEIDNPNHFGSVGGTGGNIGMINNNQLTNSDFYTGAFPAEFGNLTSGLFDLRLRNGNSHKREFLASLGFNGFELGAEGGFSKKSNASYLINARYSFLQSLDAIGVDIAGTGGGVPKYQDLTMKLNFPMKKSNLSFILLPGASKIHFNDDMTDTEEWTVGDLGGEVDMKNDQFFSGLNYTYRFSTNTRLENRVSMQSFKSRIDTYTLGFMNSSRNLDYESDMRESKASYTSKLVSKLTAKNTINAGIGVGVYFSKLKDCDYENGVKEQRHNIDKSSTLLHSFLQLQHKFNDKVSILPGVYGQLYTLNNDYSIEPRLGFQWKVSPTVTIGSSTGLYSQLQPRLIYFYERNGKPINEDVEMSRSWQSAISVDKKLGSSMRVKVEVYYQDLYNIPVTAEVPQQSTLNTGDGYGNDWDHLFENKGTGYNYGVELTLEKFFQKNWYFMLTASLYESKYRGYDEVLRDTRFNGNFALNVLAGYEFKIGARSLMSFNLKMSLMGNKRYTPATTTDGYNIDEDFTKINTIKLPNYFRTDFNINIKTNYKRVALEYFFEIDNLTNHKNVWTYWTQYYSNTNMIKERYRYQQTLTPMGGMRFYF